jgi:hypothetical protein
MLIEASKPPNNVRSTARPHQYHQLPSRANAPRSAEARSTSALCWIVLVLSALRATPNTTEPGPLL